MISQEKLLAVRKVIAHGGKCPDGRASAMIANDIYRRLHSGVEVKFVIYGTKEHEELEPEPGLLFVDFSVPPKKADAFLEAETIILDHHRGPVQEDGTYLTKELVKRFEKAGLGAFADEEDDPGVSGASLVYTYVWEALASGVETYVPEESRQIVKRMAHLAGIRDTWQTKHEDWTASCEQAEALMFWPESYLLRALVPEWEGIVEVVGPMLWDKKVQIASRVAKNAYRWTSKKGTRAVIFTGLKLSSDVAEAVDTDADLIIGFDCIHEDGKLKMLWSTRSHTTFDCASFAGAHKGGGHTKAAGFNVVMNLEESPNPYKLARDLLDTYEAGV